MTNYQNFFVQTVVRSLQTASDSLAHELALSNDIRDRSLAALDLAFKPQVVTASWPQTCQLILALSPKMEQAGHWDDWQPYLHQASTISQTAQDPKAEAAISIQIGILQQRQGQIEPAKRWFHQSVERAKIADDKSLQALALNRLGFIASMQDKVTEASVYVREALALMPKADPQREYSYMVLGNVAIRLQEPQNAANHFQFAIDICRENGDLRRVATCLNNLGIARHWLGMYQAALDTYGEAAAIWQEINDPVELAVTKMNQGVVHEALNDPITALRHYSEAKPILEKAQNSLNLAKLYNNQGYSYYKLKRWEEAEEIYRASLIQWQPLESWTDYANTMDNLGIIYHEQGRWDEAIQTFQEALRILSKIPEKDVVTHLVQEIRENLEKSYAALE